MKRILFVDDETKVLEALKRLLYPFRAEWEMVFVCSGEEALRCMAEQEFDVLITDMRMPGMTGIELLSRVVNEYPSVVRMVLSGTADQEATLRSITLAHQYLLKPCDPKVLRAKVEHALSLRVELHNPKLKELISRLHMVPSIPGIYVELMQALQSPDASAREVGDIIARDIGMSAKILQLVNSAFFGVSRHIASPAQAAVYLGIDTVKSLALTIAVFSKFNITSFSGFTLDTLQQHSIVVGTLARDIARQLGLSRSAADDAFVGGLLHDIGKLILAENCRADYQSVFDQVKRESVTVRDAESAIFGTTHAEVGGYLLWLWGLPEPITECAARHHRIPEQWEDSPPPVLAVHIADALVNGRIEEDLDIPQLEHHGLIGHLPDWQNLHDELLIGK